MSPREAHLRAVLKRLTMHMTFLNFCFIKKKKKKSHQFYIRHHSIHEPILTVKDLQLLSLGLIGVRGRDIDLTALEPACTPGRSSNLGSLQGASKVGTGPDSVQTSALTKGPRPGANLCPRPHHWSWQSPGSSSQCL